MAAPGATSYCPNCGTSLADGFCPHCEPMTASAPAAAPPPPAAVPPPPAPAFPPPTVVAPARVPSPRSHSWTRAVLVAVLVAQTLGLALLAYGQIQVRRDERRAVREQKAALAQALRDVGKKLDDGRAETNGLSNRVGGLESKVDAQPDPAAVAQKVEASVFTVETEEGLGSGFVIASDGASSTLVTNFHVGEDVVKRGGTTVTVRRHGEQLTGTIGKTNRNNDLAAVVISKSFPALVRAETKPVPGDFVAVVGSPLGQENSFSTGVVAALRPDAIQFTAPISPGNSGGPVVNRKGEVIGVASAKLVSEGAEGLGLAYPISDVCLSVVTC